MISERRIPAFVAPNSSRHSLNVETDFTKRPTEEAVEFEAPSASLFHNNFVKNSFNILVQRMSKLDVNIFIWHRQDLAQMNFP